MSTRERGVTQRREEMHTNDQRERGGEVGGFGQTLSEKCLFFCR